MTRLSRRALLYGGLAAAAAACTHAASRPPVVGNGTGTAAAGSGGPTAAARSGGPTSRTPTSATPRLPVYIRSGDPRRRQVALTFHGAGDPRLAAALLTEAERTGAAVTVLAVGSWLEAQPALARRILGGGHELGNHTYTHPVLPRLGAAAAYAEITRCADVLRRLTGSPGRWFRPSGTPAPTRLIEAQARRAGYPSCLGYDLDPRDYTDPGAAAVAGRVLAQVRPGSIVSLHLGHEGTVRALPEILTGLHDRRLTAVTASTLLGVPS